MYHALSQFCNKRGNVNVKLSVEKLELYKNDFDVILQIYQMIFLYEVFTVNKYYTRIIV